MRKSKYKKLFTVSLSNDLYKLIKEISDQHDISMGEVIRKSLELSFRYDGDWMGETEKHDVKDELFSFDDSEFNITKGGN